MRWYIIKTLLHKEVARHRANRGGLALAGLLIVASLMLSIFGKKDGQGAGFSPTVQRCYIDYWEDGPWIDHLQSHVPDDLRASLFFRSVKRDLSSGELILYPAGTVAMQIRPLAGSALGPQYKIWLWHPGGGRESLAPFEAWFWKETQAHFLKQTSQTLANSPYVPPGTVPLPKFIEEYSALKGGLDPRSGFATALVVFALFFICVYLLPSLTCEERERGVLLAQALSPASAAEILGAKLLFYPAVAIALAGLLAGLNQPQVLSRPFFWAALAVSALGSLGIGLTISSLARSQRTASMGALCYMMGVTLILWVCQQGNIPFVSYLALEYHSPRILHAAMTGSVEWFHWYSLAATGVLSCCWFWLATVLFRRYGWQ